MAINKLTLRTVNSPYVGNAADFTKNSVLTHKEVDNNFVFLKGEDIITGSTSGTTIILTQVNDDIIEIDIAPILCSVDNYTTGATVVGSSLYFDTTDALSAYTVDLSSFLDNTNYYVTGSTLVGGTLYFDRTDTLSAFTVDLSSISGDTNTDNFTTGTTVIGATAYFDRTNALSAYTLDLSSFTADTDTNYYTTGSTVIGGTAYFDRTDSLSAFTLDLSSFTADTDTNYYTTGTTLIDKTIYFDRTDSLSAFTTDLSGIIPDADYGNIIFVSEVGPTGLTRADVVGDINKPVDIEWASQIAQSGDTIHVKSGVYNITVTGNTGLCVDGVNHIFEANSIVYKATTGPMFGKNDGVSTLSQANVFGSGSFYGSGSCGHIFENVGLDSGMTQVYEWDICENSAEGCYYGSLNGDTKLIGKRRIYSTAGEAIYQIPSEYYDLLIDCPEIQSTISHAIRNVKPGGKLGSMVVNANRILGASTSFPAIEVTDHGEENGFSINASYINYVKANGNPDYNIDLSINASRVDYLEFSGEYLNVTGHLGRLNGTFIGIADISLIDRCWAAGTGVINTTFNGNFDYTSDAVGTSLVSSIAGTIICNYKLQNKFANSPFSYNFTNDWFFSNAGGTTNLLGNWDIQNFWFTQASGRFNIPSDTVVNIGPIKSGTTFGTTGETFNLSSVEANIKGTITERCDPSAPCDDSESAMTYTSTLMYVGDWQAGSKPLSSTRIIYNGATIVLRNQNRQIITTPVTGGTIGVYSGGLNTNKLNAFAAEQEKVRVTIAGSGATITVNSETFTSTTGTTAATSAAELVNLINASGTVAATASQDVPGSDTYIYVEADVAGDELGITYGFNTILDVKIRFNTKAITDVVGGTIIEDENIIKDQYN